MTRPGRGESASSTHPADTRGMRLRPSVAVECLALVLLLLLPWICAPVLADPQPTAQPTPQPRAKDSTRPQTPVPPLPYPTREVKVEYTPHGAAKPITLAGTLALPDPSRFGPAPRAAVLFITGSGAQDRDENIFNHRPFAVIADDLAKRGIASLRLDDRGVGGSTGDFATSTTRDFAGDTAAALAFLRQQPEIDPARVGLIGHSEGGIIAPMVAADHPDQVAFVVLLAGTGVPGADVLRVQMQAGLKVAGATPEQIQRAGAAEQRLLDTITRGDATTEERDASIAALVRAQLGIDESKPPTDDDAKRIDQGVRIGRRQMSSPWMLEFVRLDPREFLRRVRCPVLVLNGSLDLQVLPSQNIPEVARALMEGGNPDVTIRVFPKLNHLFQQAATGSAFEYSLLTQTIAPEVLEAVGSWIAERTNPPAAKRPAP